LPKLKHYFAHAIASTLCAFTMMPAAAQNAATQEIAAPQQERPAWAPKGMGPALLFDAGTGDVLFEDRAGEAWYPASLTKMMTAFVVFKKIRDNQLRLDQQIVVSEQASAQAPSKVGVPPGKTVSVDWALQAVLVYSANDMAWVLAEAASGSVPAFATEMNEAAKAMGMTASHFVNPNGLFDPRQVTSARDMGVLAAVMLKEYPQHAKYFDQDYLKLGQRRLANRNALLREMPDADGMKTGFVCNSGFNLVASASRNGRRLMAVVLGSKSGQARMLAAKAMLEHGLSTTPQTTKPIATVTNVNAGLSGPVDMTPVTCPRKNPVLLADVDNLAGWSVALGPTYENPDVADIALRDYMTSPAGRIAPARGGVVRLAVEPQFSAMMWGMDQAQSEGLCTSFRAQGTSCNVNTPAFLDAVKASAEAQKQAVQAKRKRTVAQGSDVAPRQKKKPRKKKRK
jgi:D-alanyl-D-alanine carboxypeptidase